MKQRMKSQYLEPPLWVKVCCGAALLAGLPPQQPGVPPSIKAVRRLLWPSGTMRALLSALLLSSLLQLCGAAALSCSRFHNLTASDLAVQHINQHHRHGYKFSLDDVSEAQLERVAGGCRIQLQLRLKETTCPVADPRELQECGSRMMGERAVVANCSVLITVKDDNATVSRYDCQTRQEMTDREMMGMCPDCPKLLPLDDPKGLEAIQEAITEFNKNASNQRVFVLWEVGRISVGFVSSTGMNYYSEFLLVETPCPSQSRILHRACRPLCAHRARHAFCRSSYSQMKGLHLPLRCEFFPPKNTTGLGPGEKEPPCPPHLPHGPPGTPHIHGPPPHAHGPPPHAHGPPTDAQRPPPHAHGPPTDAQRPPPHAPGRHPHFPRPSHCPGPLAAADPAIHPICPWPRPARPQPRGD